MGIVQNMKPVQKCTFHILYISVVNELKTDQTPNCNAATFSGKSKTTEDKTLSVQDSSVKTNILEN